MNWGKWSLTENPPMLIHAESEYEISFSRINTSAELLDWIFQVKSKHWADADTMNDLLSAFDAILYPQAYYCSDGKDKRTSGSEMVLEFIANPNRFDVP